MLSIVLTDASIRPQNTSFTIAKLGANMASYPCKVSPDIQARAKNRVEIGDLIVAISSLFKPASQPA